MDITECKQIPEVEDVFYMYINLTLCISVLARISVEVVHCSTCIS